MLHRLVSNLLNNAVEAMPQGGQVTVSLALRADWLLLEVRDDGCGIAKQDIPRVLGGGVSVFETSVVEKVLGFVTHEEIVKKVRSRI